MKRVLRSAFEPLPRALSTQCLVALVAAVVLGIGFTVFRYVESSGPTRSTVSPAADSSVWGGSGRDGAANSAGSGWRSSTPSASLGLGASGRASDGTSRRIGFAGSVGTVSATSSSAPASTSFDPAAQGG